MTIRARKALIPATAILAAVYVVAAKLGLLLAFVHASATAVWPPTGIALAALLLLGYRVWPGILLGAFLVNLMTAGSVLSSLGIAVGNTLEGLVGAYLVNTFANGRRAFERPQDVFTFAALAAIGSTMVSATIGVTSLGLTGYADWADAGAIWVTWWLGDAGGALIVAPLLLLWSAHLPGPWTVRRAPEAALLALTLVLTGLIVFGGWHPFAGKTYPLEFLAFPVLVWAAFRFGPRATATAIFLLAGLAIWGTLRGVGPFARGTPNEGLVLLQAFMGVAAVMALALAAAVLERQRAEATVRATEERLRLIAAREQAEQALAAAQAIAHLGSWEWDLVAADVTWSDELYRIFGLTPGADGASYAAFLRQVHPDDRERVDRLITAALRDTDAFDFQCRIVRPAGEIRSIHARGEVRADDTGAPSKLLSTAHDVTELKRAEEARVLLVREQAVRAEAEAAVVARDEFVAIAAHELRTPLTTLKGFAQMLVRQLGRPTLDHGRLSDAAAQLEQQVARFERLVGDLLDVSRIHHGRLDLRRAPTDVADLARRVLTRFEHAAERTGRHTLALDAPTPVVGSLDADQLDQVLTNLLANALKYSPDGGEVRVQVRQADDQVEIAVSDPGIGIAAAAQAGLFRPFARAAGGRVRGLGLGLYIAQQIVEQHGGTIALQSEPGTGSTFTVCLPLTPPAEPAR